MKNIYFKLSMYFIGLIFVTCIAAIIIFSISVGRPIAKNFHEFVKKQILYIANQTKEKIDKNESKKEMESFIESTQAAYKIKFLVLNDKFKTKYGGKNESLDIVIDKEILDKIAKDGFYLKAGHFDKKTIFIIQRNSKNGDKIYFYFSRLSQTYKQYSFFFGGMIALFILLITAIYPLARNFTKPILELSLALEEISSGNFNEKLKIGKRDDEIGKLLKTYEKMSFSVNEIIESKKKFLADISHELRSPLARMEIALELIAEESGDVARRKYVGKVFDEIEFMTGLVRSLSIYSKINLPDFAIASKHISPAELVLSAYARFAETAKKNQICLKKKIGNGIKGIKLDENLISRVINNLMDNAFQYSSKGGTIEIGLAQSDNKTYFYISNTGEKIEDEFVEKIFEPLFRVDQSRNRNTGGLGLGLAICGSIIKLHKGQIYYSRENNKNIFTFQL